ncbi:MAG: hypothetical protein SGARI_000961, partial [Bacillariaceae sp.]
MAEQMKITQAIIHHIQKQSKHSPDVITALTMRAPATMTAYKPARLMRPREPVYPTLSNEDKDAAKDKKLKEAFEKEWAAYAEKKADYDLVKDEQQIRTTNWIRKEEHYNTGMLQAFATIWGQCNDPLKEKIKNLATFEQDIQNDPLKLLDAIEAQSIDYHEDKYDMSMVLETMRNLVNLHQGKEESLSDYASRIRSARDILVTFVGKPFVFDKQIRAVEKLSATDVITEQHIMTHWERFVAHLMLRHANPNKYGTLYQEMENQSIRDDELEMNSTLDTACCNLSQLSYHHKRNYFLLLQHLLQLLLLVDLVVDLGLVVVDQL